MRKLTRKQLLARLFAGFFAIGSLLCTVNSAVAEEPSYTYGKYYYNNEPSEFPFDNLNEIKKPNSKNIINLTITGPDSPASDIYSGYTDSNGNVENNKLTITTNEGVATKLSSVYGGYVYSDGSANLNEVHIASSTVNNSVYGGYVYSDGSANLNEVHIASSTVTGVYGGYTYKGNVLENKVHIASSTVTGYVFGGQILNTGSATGSATENVVDIASSTIICFIYGGYVEGTGNAASNSVHIDSSTVGSVYCGYAGEGNAASNSVHIESSTVGGEVRGGCVSNIGSATQNIVHIASSTVNNKVYGGYVYGTGSATQNIVDIASSTVNSEVYGGWVINGDAESNTVEISESQVGSVYGGYVKENGDVVSNNVTIKDSEVNKTVYGGYTKNGSATQNIVDIASSTVNDVYGGYVFDTGSANSNTVTIKDSIASDNIIYGGYACNGDANSNTVEITNSKAGTVWGGYIMFESATGNTNSNTLKLTDSEVSGHIVAANNQGTGVAEKNTIEISGGTLKAGYISGADVGAGSAILNKVYLSGCSSVTCERISGGFVGRGENGKANSNAVTLDNLEKLNVPWVAGGYVKSGDAVENIVRINDGSKVNAVVSGAKLSDVKVIGGYVHVNGSATNNRVELNGASSVNGAYNPDSSGTLVSDANVYGGYVGGNGKVANNTVIISGASSIKGASGVDGSGNNMVSSGKAYGGYIKNGDATENAVEISDKSTLDEAYGGFVNNDGDATNNTVKLSGASTVSGSVYGGYVGGTGKAVTGNKLIISGVGNKIGGSVENFEYVSFKLASDDDTSKSMLSVLSLDAAMDLNLVKLDTELPESGLNGEITLVDGKISAENAVYTINGTAVDGDKSLTVAQKNEGSVNVGVYKYDLSDSAIKLNAESTVAAVFQQTGKDPLSTDDRKIVVTSEMANNYSRIYGAFNADGGAATGATVELSEAVNNENLTIYGGYSTGSGVDVTTGNTLEVAKSGNKLKNILNFEKINFFTDSANNQSMLTLAADTVDLSNTYINVQFGDAPLADGQTVTLLDTKQLSLSDKKLRINDKSLDANMSLKLAAYGSDNKYVNVGDYSMKSDDTKLSITANESFLTSKYTNGNESLAVEKFELTNDFSNFKAIYGSYSADNSAAEGGKLSISQKVDLSKTTLIGGKSAGNGEVKSNTLEISSAGSKVKGLEKFDNFKFTLAAGMSGSTPMLSTTDKILLDGATIDTDLSNLDAADDTKLVLLDNTEGKAAKRLLNGKEGNIINAKKNEGFVAISSVGYSADEDKLAIDVKSEGAAGCFIDENGNLIGNGNKVLTLGGSTASNMRAGYERASSAPDISECENIYGIYSEGDSIPSGGVVEIVSPIQFNNCKIHGGYSTKRGYWSSGNTLKVDTLNARVRAITHFENMEFNLPSETRNGSIMLTVADSLDLEPTKKITVNASKATNNLKVGDKVRLIDCEGGIKHFSKQEKIIKGLTDKISDIALERSSLNLLIKGEQQNNNTKAPVEAISATTALVNYTSELAAGKLNRNMVMAVDVSRIDAAKDNSENNSNIKTVPVKTDFATFAALGGGNLTYNTGSYVKSDSWNVGFGIGKKGMSSKNPDATYGLFFQYGKSNFSTHNDGGYRGDGDSKMFGAGLMFHQEANSKYYYQGSISAGKVDADWSCKDGSYDDKATYYSMTFGMGHKHNVGGNKTMDVYGRYSFNHVGSMEGDLNGDKYDFDSTNSHNLRFGFRMEYAKKNAATAYWGLAWEHEFTGASGATLTTPNIVERTASPSLKGDSGIAEVGYQWKRGNWEYNINAEGSFGKREGVTGSFNINYNF